jgi:fermentation-respiration switch protein FrsA (DUF1100 family)
VSARQGKLAALLGVVLAGCSLVSLDDLIFFPDRSMPDPPPGVEERGITAADGVRLHAWYAPPPADGPVLVWSHGNGGNIGGRGEVLLALAAAEVGVLAYDYRGYGKSAGRPSEAGVYLDVEAAYDDVRALGIAPARIVAFGESLGSSVALHLALRRPCAAVVLVSPFTSMADVARHHYGPLGLLARNRFDSRSRVRKLTVPLLVLHGDEDEVVPFELGEELFAAAPEPKRFVRVAGAHHNDVFDPEVVHAIATFARETAR